MGGGAGGLSSNTQLGQTTAAQRTALCESHKADLMSSATSYCVTAGIGMASKMLCEQKRDECVAKVAIDCNTSFGDLMSCTVTVGEFETCFPQVVSWAKSLSCDNFDQRLPTLPSCVDMLNTKCPGALDMIGMM
jgi:hypothetical protein